MQEISPRELYEIFRHEVKRCSSRLRAADDETIECELFEEFNSAAVSFLHENSLRRLRIAGLIDDRIMALALRVRKEFLSMETRGKWSVEAVRNDDAWTRLFELCEQLDALCTAFERSTS